MAEEKFDLVVRAKDEASMVLGKIGGNMVGLATAAAGLAVIGTFLKSSVSAAIESEKAWNKLGNAVDKHGGIWDAVRVRFQTFATTLQNQTGISDEAIAESLQLFIDFGASGQQAMDRVRIAADLAAGANIDFASATSLLAKASAGATEMLGRYGIRVDENLSKSEKFAAALDIISDRFGGRAAENAKTLAGRLEILNQQFGDLQENIGGLTVGPLTGLVSGLNDVLTVVNSNISVWEKFGIAAKFFFSPLAGAAAPLVWKNALDDIAEAASKARLAMLSMHEATGMPGAGKPPIDPEEVKRAEEALKKLNEQIQANNAFIFENMGLTGSFEVQNESWRKRAEFMDAEKERLTSGAMDQMSTTFDFARTVWADQAAASDKLKEESARNFQDFANMIQGSMAGAADQLVGIMFGVRASFADIFKGMAQDWFRYFIGALLKRTAANLAANILSAIPGLGPILGVAGGAAGKVSVPSGGGLDIGSAGANRFSASGVARKANVNVIIQGDVIGEQEYVTRRIVPAIELAVAYGQSKLAVR